NTSSAPYRFGEKRVATLTLLTFTAPSRPLSCGVDITKFSDHVVAFLSSPTLFADTPMSRSASTRILSGKPPRAMWSAATLLGLYRIRVLPDGPIPLWYCLKQSTTSFSLDHLVGAGEQRRRDRKPKRLCSVKVDNQIELGRLYNRQVCRLGTLENSSGIVAREPPRVWDAGTIADQSTGSGQLAVSVNCRDAMLRSQCNKLTTSLEKERVLADEEHPDALLRHRGEGGFKIVLTRGREHEQLLSDCLRVALQLTQFLQRIRAAWMAEQRNHAHIRDKLARKLKSLPAETRADKGDAGD